MVSKKTCYSKRDAPGAVDSPVKTPAFLDIFWTGVEIHSVSVTYVCYNVRTIINPSKFD